MAETSVYTALLRFCADARALSHGRRLHAHISKHGRDCETYFANLLVRMYGKCQSAEESRAVFGRICRPDSFSWNAIISALSQNGHPKEAFQLWIRMCSEGFIPDKFAFLPLLSAFAAQADLCNGKRIHKLIIDSGFASDSLIENGLLKMYCKCGSVRDARIVFDRLSKRSIVAWTSMIGAYVRNGHGKGALELLKQMDLVGVNPDNVAFICLLGACTSLRSLEQGRAIHERIAMNGGADISVNNALLSMYGQCGSLEEARAVFEEMKQRDVISWNAMTKAYAQNGHCEEALNLFFNRMHVEGVNVNKVTLLCLLDACTWLSSLENGKAIHEWIVKNGFGEDSILKTALLKMYAKCGSLKAAHSVFNGMRSRDLISWTTMLTAYAQHRHWKEALELLSEMDSEGMKPDEVTFLCLLNGCTSSASLEHGETIHERIVKYGFDSDISVQNALLSMYARCGNLKKARVVFDQMTKRDVISWTAIVAAYGQNGHGKEALESFHQMCSEGVKPDRVTFLVTLEACASLASLEKGQEIHKHIACGGFESDITVANALINMYGKCGSLEDAQSVFRRMRQRDKVSWTAMIAAYTQNGCADEALECFYRMDSEEGIKPDKVAIVGILDTCATLASLENGRAIHKYISTTVSGELKSGITVNNALINMYGKCGSLREARAVFDKMQQRDVISWTTMIVTCAQNGDSNEALELFGRMLSEGMKPDNITFLGILTACSHAGLHSEGLRYFDSLSREYGLIPTQEHYVCMIDLLGRSGCLNEAEDMVTNMPIQTDTFAWTTFLRACQSHNDMERGVCAVQRAFWSNRKYGSSNVVLDIYVAAWGWDAVRKLSINYIGEASTSEG